MSYTNVDIRDTYEWRDKEFEMLKAEKIYYEKRCIDLQRKLENIPESVVENGYVEITYFHGDKRTITLVKEGENRGGQKLK